MLRTFLKTVFRSSLRDRLMSSINITGMAFGLAAGLLILLFVAREYSHDAFHTAADRIYRVEYTSVSDGRTTRMADTPFRLGDELAEGYPAVEDVTRYLPDFTVLRIGDSVEYQGIYYVDPAFFDVFSFPAVQGDESAALDTPESAVVTQEFARRLFGKASAVGETISLKLNDAFRDFTITAVLADIPESSSLVFEILLPFSAASPGAVRQDTYDQWHGQTATFVRLRAGVDAGVFQTSLQSIVSTYGDALLNGRDSFSFGLTPLTDIYFDTGATRGITRSATPDQANLLFWIAVLIILTACVNFTTLSIARSARQNRGIGIRKVVGATRGMVATEYLMDALVKTGLAALLGLALAELFSDRFGDLVGMPVHLDALLTPTFALAFVGLVLVVGVLAGAYPAFRLSAIRPISVLQGHALVKSRSRLIRGLVILQFGITTVLLIGAVTISQQISFLQQLDRGLDLENIVVVRPDFTSSSTGPELYRQLKATTSPDIASVARSGGMLGSSFGTLTLDVDGESKRITTITVSPEFMDMLGLVPVAGSPITEAEANGLVVNRAFAELMQRSPDALVGTSILDAYRVSGVTDNYYFNSVSREIGPFALQSITPDYPGGYVLFRHAEGRRQEALATVQEVWKSIAPDVPFQSYDLKADMTDPSGSAARLRRIVRYSTYFSILIACLGLFGLSTLTAIQRTKEIGIRKALGAGQVRLTGLLVRETALLALVAGVLATPVGWVLMNNWLSDYATRISVDPVTIGLICCILVGIAVATVSVQSIRASRTNPVDCLRQE